MKTFIIFLYSFFLFFSFFTLAKEEAILNKISPIDERKIIGKWGKTNKEGIKCRIVGYYSLFTKYENCVLEFYNSTKKEKFLILDKTSFLSNTDVIQYFDFISKEWKYIPKRLEYYYKDSYCLVIIKSNSSLFLRVGYVSNFYGQPMPYNIKQFRYKPDRSLLKKILKDKKRDKRIKENICSTEIETAPVVLNLKGMKYNDNIGPEIFILSPVKTKR